MIALGTLESTPACPMHKLSQDVTCPCKRVVVVLPACWGGTQPRAPGALCSAGSTPTLHLQGVNLLLICARLGAQSPLQCPGYVIRYWHTKCTPTGCGKHGAKKNPKHRKHGRHGSKMALNKHHIRNWACIPAKNLSSPWQDLRSEQFALWNV